MHSIIFTALKCVSQQSGDTFPCHIITPQKSDKFLETLEVPFSFFPACECGCAAANRLTAEEHRELRYQTKGNILIACR